MSDLLERVHLLADDVLFPAAIEVDRTGEIPAEHWDRLAAEGLYGAAAPPELGGPGIGLPEIVEALEAMAGGCLATTFTWIQHHGLVMALSGSANTALRDELLPDLTAGSAGPGSRSPASSPIHPGCRPSASTAGGGSAARRRS